MPPSISSCGRRLYRFGSMTQMSVAVMAMWSVLAVRDSRTMTLQENRGQGRHRRREGRRHPGFVKTSNGDRVLDEASLARACRLVGPKGYVTNVPADVMPAGEAAGRLDASNEDRCTPRGHGPRCSRGNGDERNAISCSELRKSLS